MALPLFLAGDWHGICWFIVSLVNFYLHINISDGFNMLFHSSLNFVLLLKAIMQQGLSFHFYALVFNPSFTQRTYYLSSILLL